MKQTLGRLLFQPNKDFPLDCETLSDIQNNISMVAVLGNIAGDKTILQGCALEHNNTRRQAGYVFLRTQDFPDGEVLYWEGGTISGGIYIKQEVVSISVQGYEYPQAYFVRSLAAGIGIENYSWSDFKALHTNQDLSQELNNQNKEIAKLAPPPLGLVYPWAGNITGNAVPHDYMICDGARLVTADYPELFAVISRLHTPTSVPGGYFCLPDLRSRFVVGFNSEDEDYNAIAKSGGEKKHTLTTSEMPAHSHSLFLQNSGTRFTGSGRANELNSGNGNTGSTGENAAHENRPPYYTLAYIMRVK